ncbi:MAG: thiolase domain-containing protein [Candidatus Ranarchaeia archaeon]
MSRKVVVIGAGMTKVKTVYNQGIRDIFADASQSALEDATVSQVDVLFLGNMNASRLSGQANLGAICAEAAGLGNIPAIHIEGACGSGGLAVIEGYRAVASGLYETVMVGGVEKMTEYTTGATNEALVEAADQEYEAYHGASFAALNALLFRYYLDQFKIAREDFAMWPVKMHEHAMNNPYAQLRFPTTVEKALSSSIIADPLRLFDCSPIGDGAAALILTTEDNAKKIGLDQPTVVFAGVGEAIDTVALYRRDDLLSLKATRISAKHAYKQAGIKPENVEVAEIHDAFSIMGILAIEDLGFATKGQGLKLVRNGDIDKTGGIPINMSGGLKARGHPVGATGVYQVAEIFNQLRGKAGDMQVQDAKIGLAHSIGGSGATITTTILKRLD